MAASEVMRLVGSIISSLDNCNNIEFSDEDFFYRPVPEAAGPISTLLILPSFT